MKRRNFLGASLSGTALTASSYASAPSGGPGDQAEGDDLESLRRIREQCRKDLFDDYLPFCEKHVNDPVHGGFVCSVRPDGSPVTRNKRTWYLGRGAWVYSFLYNHFDKKDEYLEIARRALDLVLRYKKPDPDRFYPDEFTFEGEPTAPHSDIIFNDLFVAEGAQEFAAASGRAEYDDHSRELLFNAIRIWDRPEYVEPWNPLELPRGSRLGVRQAGVWFVGLRTVTQMLERQQDARLQEFADRCVEAVIKHHYNPRFRLNNEFVNHDLSRPEGPLENLCYTGHAIETLWMVLKEAIRQRDATLMRTVMERFRRHVEVARDDVYGGVFTSLDNVDRNIWTLPKACWAQEEVLIGAALCLEHLGDAWSWETLLEFFEYLQANYPLRRHGFDSPKWIDYAPGRQVTYDPTPGRQRLENYHHPRQLMELLLTMDRILERGGRTSGLIASDRV